MTRKQAREDVETVMGLVVQAAQMVMWSSSVTEQNKWRKEMQRHTRAFKRSLATFEKVIEEGQ